MCDNRIEPSVTLHTLARDQLESACSSLFKHAFESLPASEGTPRSPVKLRINIEQNDYVKKSHCIWEKDSFLKELKKHFASFKRYSPFLLFVRLQECHKIDNYIKEHESYIKSHFQGGLNYLLGTQNKKVLHKNLGDLKEKLNKNKTEFAEKAQLSIYLTPSEMKPSVLAKKLIDIENWLIKNHYKKAKTCLDQDVPIGGGEGCTYFSMRIENFMPGRGYSNIYGDEGERALNDIYEKDFLLAEKEKNNKKEVKSQKKDMAKKGGAYISRDKAKELKKNGLDLKKMLSDSEYFNQLNFELKKEKERLIKPEWRKYMLLGVVLGLICIALLILPSVVSLTPAVYASTIIGSIVVFLMATLSFLTGISRGGKLKNHQTLKNLNPSIVDSRKKPELIQQRGGRESVTNEFINNGQNGVRETLVLK